MTTAVNPLEILVFRIPEIAVLDHRGKPKKRALSYYLTLVRAVSGLTWYSTMNGENRPLVTDEPVQLRNSRLKFKTSGKLPIISEESVEYTSHYQSALRKITTCNRLDLETLGSRLLMPKNLPGHWYSSSTFISCSSGFLHSTVIEEDSTPDGKLSEF